MSGAQRTLIDGAHGLRARMFRGLSLRALLLLLVIAGILPLLGFSLARQYIAYQEARAAAAQRALTLARNLSLVVERELQVRIAALQVLSHSDALQAGDLAAFRRRAERVVAEQFPGSNILLLRTDGQQLMNLAAAPGDPLPARRELDSLRAATSIGRAVVSDLFQAMVMNRPIVAIDVPVKDAEGRVTQILSLNPPLHEFDAVIHQQRFAPGWVVSIFDRKGINIARTPNPEQFIGVKAGPAFLAQLMAAREGTVPSSISREGIALVSAFTHSELYGWAIGIGIPETELIAPALQSTLRVLALGGAVLLIALVLALVLARQISQPIATLRRLAAATDGAARLHPPATGLREVDEVAEALRLAEEDRRRSEAEGRHATTELEALLERQRMILERMPIGCIVTDDERLFTYWNPAAERMFGYRFAEVEGKDPFGTITEPVEQRGVIELRDRLARGEAVADSVGENLTKDGRHITCEWRMTSLRNTDGSFAGVLSMCIDVTERRQIEEQLRQAQKMEIVGQLTGGLAHDFNNLLSVILGGVDLIGEQLADRPELRVELERVARAGERGATLTRSLLAFARKQPLNPIHVDVSRLVRDTETLLIRALGETIEIAVVAGAGLWRCEVDPGQLQNALINLAVNARDAMPGGGKLTIETGNARLDTDYAAHHAEVVPGQYVVLTVSDTGGGMPPEVVAHAFEPFFTTKPAGRGTGLGLSMVYGFVKQSGGHVKIYSEVGHGTSIKLYLPRSFEATVAPGAERESAEPPGGREAILVVEDDADVRDLAVRQLQDLGYAVSAAASANDAAQILAGQRIALLITDVVLGGGVNGRQVAEQAIRLQPALLVLYMSGYTENAILHHGRLDPGVELLQKPFRKRELAIKVRAMLDRRS